ncbi:NUDIX hydrolase [Jatrophihabitans sp.]|uniref:NUDIX hydrolase n=1 Tax=Jatrophihabitans sp. TaxID=1932789 RepID=UPI0030C67E58|nr:hypothetical protein [Jatrophihabitans sp.]
MLPVGWLVFAVVVAILVSMWVTFTLTRLDRLHARVDAARAALDAQLVRRAAALLHAAEAPGSSVDPVERRRLEDVARAALTLEQPDRRQAVENAVGRAVAELAEAPDALAALPLAELGEAAARVLVARRFYNDAVRDTRALRARRMPRLLRLAGRVELPQYFDIDDTVPLGVGATTQAESQGQDGS